MSRYFRWVGSMILAVTLAACGDRTATAPIEDAELARVRSSRAPRCPALPANTKSIRLSPSTAQMMVGNTVALIATNDKGKPVAACALTWSSSNATIATVNSSGLVTGKGAGGPVTITARTTDRRQLVARATVTVTQRPVAALTVSPPSASLFVGQSQQLVATPTDASGNLLTGRTAVWASSNAAVASVSTGGLVTALTSGVTTITATIDGISATATITATVAFPRSGLIAFFPFNGNTLDSTANHNDYVNQGGVFTSNRFGTAAAAMKFQALGDQLTREWPDFPKNEFTVSLWAKIEGEYDYNSFSFFEWGDDFIASAGGQGVSIGVDANWFYKGCSSPFYAYALEVFVGTGRDAGVSGLCASYTSVSQWNHLLVTSGGGSTTIYLNGTLAGTFSSGSPIATMNTTSWVGNRNNVPASLTTRFVDDLAIWNRVLTPTEISAVFNKGN